MRAVCTLATKECQEGLRVLVASLRKSGWTSPVHVFTPSNEHRLALPPDCVQHRTDAWWSAGHAAHSAVDSGAHKGSRARRGGSVTLESVCNVPALAKPDMFLAFNDGTDVLYLDGADIAVFENPTTLFDLFDACEPARCIAVRPYEPLAENLSQGKPEHAYLARLLADVKMGPRYNDGVVLARMNCTTRLFMRYWKQVLGHAAYLGSFAGAGSRRTVVGDQVAFNICIAALSAYRHVLDLPPEWNYRGYQNVNHCVIKDSGLYSPDGRRVCIAHCSGSRDMRKDIKLLAGG